MVAAAEVAVAVELVSESEAVPVAVPEALVAVPFALIWLVPPQMVSDREKKKLDCSGLAG